MAILKIKQLQDCYVSDNPNVLGIMPDFIGQIKIRTGTKQAFFAAGLTTTSWGTCGTAGG